FRGMYGSAARLVQKVLAGGQRIEDRSEVAALPRAQSGRRTADGSLQTRLAGIEFDEIDGFGLIGQCELRLRRDGADRARLADRDHVLCALLLEDALHALDGETLIVEAMLDALEQLDVVGAVIAP